MVRDLDPYAKRRVQAILRRCGRGQATDLRNLSDGEDGLRGVVGTWFGKKCQHRLDWFHVARRIARIEKEFLYLPYGHDFHERLAAHWANLNSMKWMLWNDGVEMADFGMTRVRIGLFQHSRAHYGASANVPQVPQVHQICVRTDLAAKSRLSLRFNRNRHRAC